MPLRIQTLISESVRETETLRIENAVRRIASDYEWEDGEISIAIIGDDEIHQINKNYLNHDYPTDVLSFDLTETDAFLEGEIIASIETADREAPEHGWTGDDELLLYIIHGMLHIVGLLDKEPDDIVQMRAEEKHYLEILGAKMA